MLCSILSILFTKLGAMKLSECRDTNRSLKDLYNAQELVSELLVVGLSSKIGD